GLDRFGDVRGPDAGLAFEIRDGTRHAEHFEVGARREPELVHRGLDQAATFSVERDDALDFGSGQERVEGRGEAEGLGALALKRPSVQDALTHLGRRLGARNARKRRQLDRRSLDVDVEPLEQRPGKARAVALARFGRAAAAAARMPEKATRARIEGRDDDGASGKPGARPRAGDAHAPVFERLAQRFDRGTTKLGKLVEEQHAVMREADLAGTWGLAATHERRLAHRMMGRAEGT